MQCLQIFRFIILIYFDKTGAQFGIVITCRLNAFKFQYFTWQKWFLLRIFSREKGCSFVLLWESSGQSMESRISGLGFHCWTWSPYLGNGWPYNMMLIRQIKTHFRKQLNGGETLNSIIIEALILRSRRENEKMYEWGHFLAANLVSV